MSAADDVGAVLDRLEAGELGEPLVVLAFLASRELELPDGELRESRRRAMLVLAAGGDPHRALDVDEPAVKSLAADLFTDERRRTLGSAIDALALLARDLPRVRDATLFLAADPEPRGGSSHSRSWPRSSRTDPDEGSRVRRPPPRTSGCDRGSAAPSSWRPWRPFSSCPSRARRSCSTGTRRTSGCS